MAGQAEKKAILFVCLGNICRSPMALCIFNHLLKEQNKQDQWITDSVGTMSWHEGHPMDNRTAAVLQRHNISCEHTARQIDDRDLAKSDYVIVMSHANYGDIRNIRTRTDRNYVTKEGQKLMFLGDYDPLGQQEVDDPYYAKEEEAFEECYQHIYRSCVNMLVKLEKKEFIESHIRFG